MYIYILSESFCDSGMCRPWLASVTVGVDLLVNWEILKDPFFKDFPPASVRNQKTYDMSEDQVSRGTSRPSAEGPAQSVA